MEVISFPIWLWLGCTWKWYSHFGDVQPRVSNKVMDIVKCFWCTFGPLSSVLYLSLLSDYKLVHWRSVLSRSRAHGNHASPKSLSLYCSNQYYTLRFYGKSNAALWFGARHPCCHEPCKHYAACLLYEGSWAVYMRPGRLFLRCRAQLL